MLRKKSWIYVIVLFVITPTAFSVLSAVPYNQAGLQGSGSGEIQLQFFAEFETEQEWDSLLQSPDLSIASLEPLNVGPAPDCLDYANYEPWISRIPTAGGDVQIETSGDLLIIGESNGRLRVLDISDPGSPLLLLDDYGSRSITSMAASDTLLVVTRYEKGEDPWRNDSISRFQLYSLADTDNIRLIQTGYLSTPWYGFDWVSLTPYSCQIVEGKMIVITRGSMGKGGVILFAYGEDGLFHQREAHQTYNLISATIHGGHAYLFYYYEDASLRVFDLRQGSFDFVSKIGFENFIMLQGLAVGDYLYASDRYGQLGVLPIDQGVPNPELLHSVKVASSSGRFALTPDGRIQMGTYAEGFATIDITDPVRPAPIHNCVLPGGGVDFSLTRDGTTVASTLDGVWLLPPAAHDRMAKATVTGWKVRSVLAQDGLLYCVEGYDFTIHRIRPDGSLDLLGEHKMATSLGAIYTDNRLAVLKTRWFEFSGPIEILDVSEPDSPVHIMSVSNLRGLDKAVIRGDTILVVGDGLQVIDVSDRANPCVIYDDDRLISDIEMKGNLGLLQVRTPIHPYSYRIEAIDCTDLQNPVTIGAFPLESRIQDLTWLCDNTFVAGTGSRLAVLEISDECQVEFMGDFKAGASINGLFLDGQTLYAATYDGTAIFDLTDKHQPQKIGHVLGTYISGVSVSDGRLFQVARYQLLTVPANCQPALEVVIDFKPGSIVNGFNCQSDHGVLAVAILTTEEFDAREVDHTTVRFGPNGALEAHENRFGLKRHEVDVDGDRDLDLLFHFLLAETGLACDDQEAVLTGQTFNGLRIRGVDTIRPGGEYGDGPGEGPNKSESAKPAIGLYPNPFNPRTVLSFELEQAERVRVEVYDVQGRRVKVIQDGLLEPGIHALPWSGCDDLGRSAAAGIYFFRVRTESGDWSRKGLLLK